MAAAPAAGEAAVASSSSRESSRQDHATPSSSVKHYVEQVCRPGRRFFNKFSTNSCKDMRPPNAHQDEDLNLLQPKLKKWTLKELREATENFNERNRLGFEPVYKATLTSGSVVAVRMVATSDEFQNELNLTNALEHGNLIQLLGYCAEDSERLLVYEYLRSRRLDNLLFDRYASSEALPWAVRVNIIKGVAKGLCYLHEYAPFKIVHRDIKPMNIYLDENMNPKIYDFGIAKQLDVSCISTAVAGTPGYIAPDYLMTGELTEKIDVYSFGMLILETLSGQKHIPNAHVLEREEIRTLFENEEEMQLLDPRITDTEVSVHKVRELVHVALLCTQATSDERPSMSQVYTMLSNDVENMPLPHQPST